MSEKRFTRLEFSNGIWGVKDNNTGYEYPSPIDLLDLLNELNEENQRLKNDCGMLVQSNQEYREENEQLKQQLLYDGDDVCGICKHEYLTPCGDYFIGKCKKGHEECSKKDIKYCEDFELEWDD